ncbi:hypothetical protein [Microbispora bryophytorum]|uniref:hypothetical protein n=1 Tax=Microbispora bryophytorum TaxID=1460882 RepID=UPI003404C714
MDIPSDAQPIWSGPGSAAIIDFGTGRGVFFPHWFEFLTLAAQSRDRARETSASSAEGQPVAEALTAILFSALSAEAFINELAEVAERVTDLPQSEAQFRTFSDLAETLDMIEKSQGQIDLKYQLASKVLSGKTFRRGESPLQDFSNLIQLRNELVHPRHRDRTTSMGHVQPAAKIIRDLQQRGLTTTRGRKQGDVPGGMSWLDEVKSAAVAGWAYETARVTITAILEMLPDDKRSPAPILFRDRMEQIPR